MGQSQDAVRQFGPVGPEHNLKLGLLGQRPRGMTQRALEGFGGSIRGGHGPQLIASRLR